MPSFAIFDCSVVRFMPSLAAAPDGTADEPVRLLQRPTNMVAFSVFESGELARHGGLR